jgi:hypothetical protein
MFFNIFDDRLLSVLIQQIGYFSYTLSDNSVIFIVILALAIGVCLNIPPAKLL